MISADLPQHQTYAYEADELILGIGSSHSTQPMSFKIPSGALTCVIGKNGSGKSTLLKGLAGLGTIRSGTLTYHKTSIHELLSHIRCRQISWCGESIMLPPQFSVRESIALGLYPRLRRAPRHSEIKEVDKLGEKFGLTDLLNKNTHQLSSGERRKVALMRTLIQKPQTLLLDEPTSGLDPSSVSYLMNTLIDLTTTRITVVCILHQIHVVSTFAHHVIALKQGQIMSCKDSCSFFASSDLEDLFGLPVVTSTSSKPLISTLDYHSDPPPYFQ